MRPLVAQWPRLLPDLHGFVREGEEREEHEGNRGEIKGGKRKIQTHTHTIDVRICSAWLEEPSPIESQGKDREVESLAKDRKITGRNPDSKREYQR